MSFFTVGERYRDQYQIETVEPFFQGEWATATVGGEKVYLQHTQLQKPAPPRAIQQYLSLKNHPLILPYTQVFSEERSLVFIRPYVAYRERLNETVARGGVDEDTILEWVRTLFPVEDVLKEKPLRMYTLLHPSNIGMTEEGQLQILFCGVDGRTLPDPVIDWGNLLYMLFTGHMLDEPIKKLPPETNFPKPLGRFIQRSFNRPSRYVSSQLETYLKRRDSKGVLDHLLRRSGVKKEASSAPPMQVEPSSSEAVKKQDQTQSESQADIPPVPSYHPDPPSHSSSVLQQRLEQARKAKLEAEQRERERLKRQEESGETKEQAQEEAEHQARLKAEQIVRKRLEREAAKRAEAERRTQEEAERQARLERERLERKAAEQAEAERRAQEEAERQARLEAEQMEREHLERKAAEQAEAERRTQEEAERQARLEAEQMEREHLERKAEEQAEAERRAQEEAERQARLEAEQMEREHLERKAA
ncbi:hypothetical protein JOE21_001854, partial [Desmospora profundinema]